MRRAVPAFTHCLVKRLSMYDARFDASPGMAVWDDELWKAFEGKSTGVRRRQTPPRKRNRMRPVVWISLVLFVLLWVIWRDVAGL
jgi:hypothetical protein